jgi:hypothetical protein
MEVLDHQSNSHIITLHIIVLQTMGIVYMKHSSLFDKTLKNLQST